VAAAAAAGRAAASATAADGSAAAAKAEATGMKTEVTAALERKMHAALDASLVTLRKEAGSQVRLGVSGDSFFIGAADGSASNSCLTVVSEASDAMLHETVSLGATGHPQH
jgi:hypothetical protein